MLSLSKMHRVGIIFYAFFVLVFGTGISFASGEPGTLKWKSMTITDIDLACKITLAYVSPEGKST